MHVRQQIRNQMVTTLTGLTTTGANVFSTRVYDIDTTPCLVIYTDTDTVEPDVYTDGKDWHDLTVTIEAYVKATTLAEDITDTICEEVETAIFTDTTLNGTVKDIRLQGTKIEFGAEIDQPVVKATITFETNYRISSSAPGTQVA